jgi:hypothetical protein
MTARSSGGARTAFLAAALATLLLSAASDVRAGDDAKGGAAGTAGASAMASAVAKIEEKYAPAMETLGQWCGDSTLFVERAQIAEALLLVDSENEKARSWLRYVRQKDRTWKQTNARPFFDEKKELLPEWTKRRAAALDPMRAELEPFLAERDDWRTAGVRDRVLRTLVAVWADDADLHDRNGETSIDGKWLLKETVGVAVRRRRLIDVASAALKTAVTDASAYPQRVAEYGTCVTAPDFELRARVPPAEAVEMAARITAARAVADEFLFQRSRFRPGFVFHLFGSIEEGRRFLASRPDVSPERRKFGDGRGSWWPTDDELVVDDDAREKRLDDCVRQTFDMLRRADGYHLYYAPGFLSEGVGMYLTWALLGTRLTVFVQTTQYADQARRELADAGADWVNVVRKQVLEKGVAPNLKVLIGTPLNSMTRDDGVMSYALAAYFLEGRPDDFRRLFGTMTRKHGFPESLAETLDIDVEGLELRFVRWLRETK